MKLTLVKNSNGQHFCPHTIIKVAKGNGSQWLRDKRIRARCREDRENPDTMPKEGAGRVPKK